MKKTFKILLVALFLIGVFSTAHAVIWKNASLVPVAWDAVVTLDNGDPLPAGNTVSYVVYIVPAAGIADADNLKIEVGRTPDAFFNIPMPGEGEFYFGASAERLVNAVKVSESTVSWSFDASKCQGGEELGIRFYLIPASPEGFR